MWRRGKLLLVIALAVSAAGSYYLYVLGRRFLSQEPAPSESAIRARLSEAALPTASSETQVVTLYFPSYSEGTLVAESRTVAVAATDSARIRQIVLELIEGSKRGNSPPLPPAAAVRAAFLASDGTAYVDLGGELSSGVGAGIATETLAVYSIVGSLAANIAAVKKVKILVQEQEVDTLDGHVDLSGFFVADLERLSMRP